MTLLQKVREHALGRDGHCRLFSYLVGACDGKSELAHLEEMRRFKTRGKAEKDRHTTQGTAILCERHHDDYDAHKFRAAFLTLNGADGPMLWYADGKYFTEGIQ